MTSEDPKHPSSNMSHQLPDWEGHAPPPPAPLPSLVSLSSSDGILKPRSGFIAKHTRFSSQPAVTKEVPPVTRADFPKPTFQERFDRVFPPHRTYFGRNRRVFLIALSILLVCILIFILGLGLGLGLSREKGASQENLPLPPSTTATTGDITFFDTGIGACGRTTTSHDFICAVSHILYDAAASPSDTNTNDNPLCGHSIRITRYDDRVGSNRSVDVVVVDRCVGCAVGDLDLSYDAFDQVADRDLGRVKGVWAWLN